MKWLALIACGTAAAGTGYVRFGRSPGSASVWIDLAFLVSCAVGVALVTSRVYTRVTRLTRRELFTRTLAPDDDPNDDQVDRV